jgi:hypothetical protein
VEIGPRRERHEVVVALSFFFGEEERRQRHTLDESEFWIKYDGWNTIQRRRKEGRKGESLYTPTEGRKRSRR